MYWNKKHIIPKSYSILLELVFLVVVLNLNCKKIPIIDTLLSKISIGNKNLQNTELRNLSYGIIMNPNGIAFYQNALDINSKIENIPYGEKVFFTNAPINPESEEANDWYSIQYKDKKGFVYSVNAYTANDWISFNHTYSYNEKTNQEEPAYSMIQVNKATLYNLPSEDSKIIGEIEIYSLIQVLANGQKYDSFISNNIDLEMEGPLLNWYEIFYDGQIGYILNSINYPASKEATKLLVKDKIINEKGYFILTSYEPILYNADTKKILGDYYTVKVKSTNVILDSTESREINGETVYLINLSDKIDIQLRQINHKPEDELIPYNAYISRKDGRYFNEKKFTDYTIANTNFKGDFNAMSIMRNEFEKRGIYLNFLNFTLHKIADDKTKKYTFWIASASIGINDMSVAGIQNVHSIILKENDGVYEPVSDSIYTSSTIKYKDLDGDGNIEMILKVPTFGGEDTFIYVLKDDKYISLNQTLYSNGIYEIYLKGNKIVGKKNITSEDGKTSKEEFHYYRYKNGELIEIKK